MFAVGEGTKEGVCCGQIENALPNLQLLTNSVCDCFLFLCSAS